MIGSQAAATLQQSDRYFSLIIDCRCDTEAASTAVHCCRTGNKEKIAPKIEKETRAVNYIHFVNILLLSLFSASTITERE